MARVSQDRGEPSDAERVAAVLGYTYVVGDLVWVRSEHHPEAVRYIAATGARVPHYMIAEVASTSVSSVYIKVSLSPDAIYQTWIARYGVWPVLEPL